MNFTKIFQTIYSRLLFPKSPSCPICGKIFFSEEEIICKICESKLEWHEKSCGICGRELKKENKSGICSNCIRLKNKSNLNFEIGCSLFSFGKYSKRLVYSIKSNGRKGLGLNAGELLANKIKNEFIQDFDIITSVPMHFKKEKARGFNQADLIAKGFTLAVDKKYVVDTLIKFEAKEQKTLPFIDRNINIKNAIKINQVNKDKLKNKRVLLIDDVYTTGATINACAAVLKREGDVSKVGFVTICSTKET